MSKKRKTINLDDIIGYVTDKEYDIPGWEYNTDGQIYVYKRKKYENL